MVSRTGASRVRGLLARRRGRRARIRNGWYWTATSATGTTTTSSTSPVGDYDWLRVDGENFAAAPVEGILQRHSDVVLASVYAVPDTVVGDQVMATLLLRDGAAFDPEGFAAFLEGEEDLGTKWAPRFVRVTDQLPETATTKVVKRVLRNEAWHCDDPVWWRPTKDAPYRLLTPEDARPRSTGPSPSADPPWAGPRRSGGTEGTRYRPISGRAYVAGWVVAPGS